MIRSARIFRATVSAVTAFWIAVAAGCTARDGGSATDAAADTGTVPADSIGSIVVPEPIPAVADTVALPSAAQGDLPPVAGETKKPIYEPRERDSVTEPRFEVGPDGKMRPIRR